MLLAVLVAVVATIIFSEAGAVAALVLLACMLPVSWYIIIAIIFGIFFVLGLWPEKHK